MGMLRPAGPKVRGGIALGRRRETIRLGLVASIEVRVLGLMACRETEGRLLGPRDQEKDTFRL